MTQQITIKFNKKRFKSLLKTISEKHNIYCLYPKTVQMCVFYMYIFCTEKFIGNKTRRDVLGECSGETDMNKNMLNFIADFEHFMKTGEVRDSNKYVCIKSTNRTKTTLLGEDGDLGTIYAKKY